MSHHVAPASLRGKRPAEPRSCRSAGFPFKPDASQLNFFMVTLDVSTRSWDHPTVSLVVNVASECGFTEDHYKDLQQLQRNFGPYHFNVLAFPCNQFGQQEPGSDKEIDSFVRRVYGVSFPLFKSSGKEPDWNFWKYLIDVNGKVVDAWGPKVSVKEIQPKIADMVRQIILKKKEEL
ncbi:hypothetical protein FQN60_012708 [Etheostoma spectabile]|uniref:Glutathione peroxidase n=1 Tax=Etheostoma spectabile TaxID=54343 RepID=A0A5J5D8F7_9PERO|nr:hypothetical protein FQN60_012708 [Etheostoma spectabile]